MFHMQNLTCWFLSLYGGIRIQMQSATTVSLPSKDAMLLFDIGCVEVSFVNALLGEQNVYLYALL
jgi:hypothetical protein